MASDKKSGMSSAVGCGGHHEASKAPSLKKGTFQAVGTYIDEGDMTTVTPSGIGVNKKTGTTQVGSSEF
jgi:hypothetical protein